MAFLKFLKGNYEALSSASKVEGQILICGDTGEMFVDIANDKRVKIGDFTVVADIAALEALDAKVVPTTRLYYVENGNILARSNGTAWVQVNKQKTADELKTMLGLGSMAYVSEVVESHLSAELVEKINASAEGNHAHSNKDVLDGITVEKVAAWDGAQAAAEAKAAELVGAHEDAVTEALAGKVDKVEGKSLISDAEIARLSGMSDGANKVEKSDVNGNIKVDGEEVVVYTHPESHAISEISGLEDALAGKLEAADIANKADKATTLAGYGIADAYTAEQADAKIAAGDEAVEGKLNAYKTTNDAAVKAAADAAAAAQSAADDAQTDVDALADIVGEVAEGKTVVGMIADAQQAAIEAATYDDTQVKADIKANSDAIAAEKLRAEGVEADLNERLAEVELFFDAAATSDETINTLKEIQEYIESDESGATEMLGKINQNTADIDAIEKDYLKAADKEELEGEISAAQEAAVSAANEYADGLDEAMDTRVKAVEAAKHEHANKAVLDTITAEMLDCLVWGTFGA